MTNLPQDNDRDLINFLKQNRPLTPKEQGNSEEELISLVNQEELRENKQIYPFVWIFPGIFVAGVLLAINGEQYYQYSYLSTERWLQETLQMTNNSDEIEVFLVESWNDTLHQNHPPQEIEQDSDWLFSVMNQSQTLSLSH